MPAITMEDDLGIVYLVDNAQQFWSELEDILAIPKGAIPTLEQLDLTLKRSLSLCAAYHEQYLQSPFQLEHACNMLLDSELFAFHSERMSDIVTSEAQSNTNPHFQFICFHVLLSFGRRRSDFFRSHKRWQPLLPFLMDHIHVEIDSDVEDTYFGNSAGVGSGSGYVGANVPVPIEAKLRSLGVRLLYEMCRVQKLSILDLRIFDDSFLDYLFDLVEQTRHMQDDTFNYSVIKLIVALNEQFMVASLGDEALSSGINGINNSYRHQQSSSADNSESKNRVLRVLMRRLGSSQTFGENMIFMLNRAQRTPEDLCMQLLVLKLLYLLFTTKGTEEYFYTNDLCVLVDVFLRELADLDDDHESLRHTYLRVLHPLLTKTQLRAVPYKRPQILYMLESLIRTSHVRDVNPTTKRLVERCLGGEWCVGLVRQKQIKEAKSINGDDDKDSEISWGAADTTVTTHTTNKLNGARSHLSVATSTSTSIGSAVTSPTTLRSSAPRTLKSSKSMEFKKSRSGNVTGHGNHNNTGMSSDEIPTHVPHSPRSPLLLESVRRGSTASNASFISANSGTSLHGVASAAAPSTSSYSHSRPPLPPPINVISPPPSSSTTTSPASRPPLSPSHSGPSPRQPRRQGTANSAHVEGAFADPNSTHHHHHHSQHGGLGESLNSTLVLSSLSGMSLNTSPTRGHFNSNAKVNSNTNINTIPTQQKEQKERRSAPPPPIQTKRRKPPAIPVGRSPAGSVSPGGGGVTFTAIKSSGGVSSPLGR
ncbi:hypothetical protein J3R30DRAFT_3694098 [Lentinula aciculospora]|uniref:SPIN90/Ldb17 leucine-rich domain-containing protein n=1 Tax=Lentinula aciculospora TaxID=153920 RepID=A0A9W9ATW5_9AGAR|nr:hypothetical protein J3R30DRAFT_3694098 [Lentinula aciculospora]